MSKKACQILCMLQKLDKPYSIYRPLSLAALTNGFEQEKPELRNRVEIDQIQDPREKSDTGPDSTKTRIMIQIPFD